MTHKFSLCAALAAALALGACDNEPETIDTSPADPMATDLANAAPIELPPSVKESHSYRCKDNSIVYVDFMSDDRSANVRTDKRALPTRVVAAAPGEPMTAEGGYSVSGMGDTIKITLPGKNAQSCSR